MRKLLIIFVLFFLVITNVFAYSIKVYDEYGNRVGTYRKEGDKYQFYDFNENKVDYPEAVIKDAPTQKTLTEYSQTFYDENMMPIGTWRSGYFSNDGRYYPRGVYYPTAFYRTNTPQIVRPRAGVNPGVGIKPEGKPEISTEEHPSIHSGLRPIVHPKEKNPNSGYFDTYYVDTKYPTFHKFK